MLRPSRHSVYHDKWPLQLKLMEILFIRELFDHSSDYFKFSLTMAANEILLISPLNYGSVFSGRELWVGVSQVLFFSRTDLFSYRNLGNTLS